MSFKGAGASLRPVRVYPISDEDATAEATELLGHTGEVRSIVFFPGETRIATGGDDGTVKIWDTATQECLLTLSGPGGAVTKIAISPDGRRVVAVGDKRIRIWDGKPMKP
jgi:WD40 repeat protein